MKVVPFLLAGSTLLVCVRCGSSPTTASSRDASSPAASQSDASTGDASDFPDASIEGGEIDVAAIDASGSIPCGPTGSCTVGQVCVSSPQASGPVGPGQSCGAPNDAGVCPAGTQRTTTCPNYMPGGGCVPSGGQSACVDVPSTCSAYCSCPAVCNVDAAYSTCTASGRYVTCSSAAP
jgi:hypothetical protein